MEIIDWVGRNIPFMALVAGQAPPHNRPLLTRLAEQAFVGVIAGAGSLYVNDVRQEDRLVTLAEKIENVTVIMDKQTQKLETRIELLDAKIDAVRDKVYDHELVVTRKAR